MTTDRMTEEFRAYLEEKASLEPGQIEAVMSDSPLVVVSAGAGTGKTLTLAWRFVRLVAVDQVPVDRILTITFTEKAALEMRERIRRLMNELPREIPEFGPLLSEALSRLDEAYVSTIHAFSMRVLKECGLSVDIDPDVRVISPPEENAFWQFLERSIDREETSHLISTLDPLWQERASELLAESETSDIINTFGPGDLCRTAAAAIPLFESRNLFPDALWAWANDIKERDTALSAELLDSFAPLWEEARETWLDRILPDAGAPDIFKGDKTKFSERGLGFINSWGSSHPKRDDLPRFILGLLSKEGLIGNLSGATGKCMKMVNASSLSVTGESLGDYRDSRPSWVAAAEWIARGFSPEETLLREKTLRFISVCWKLFESAKSSRGTLSFEDMIRGARDALSREPAYAGRFRHVIVDEFQDTNSLQDELLTSLTPSSGGTFFLVGDLQQSIYRFRHAEPEIFWRRIESAGKDHSSLVNLDVTFRCKQDVIDQVNSLFGKTWKDGVAKSTGKPFSPLMPPGSRDWWEERQKTTVKPFEIIVAADTEPGAPAKTASLRESALRLLADRIMESVSSKVTVWDSDGAGGFAPRPVRFSDIAVLVPSRTFYDILEQVFVEERRIPTYFEGNRNYFERGEVRDAVCLLEAIADPADSLAMASFLASPLSGLTPQQASDLISGSARKDEPILRSLTVSHPEIAAWFETCRRAGLAAGPSRAIAALIENDQVLLSFPSWRRSRVAANLRRGVDLAREYEAAMGRNLSGCAAYLRDVTRRGVDSKEADILGKDDNMVRVMTVHASKGLEFPVVAVTGLEQGIRTRGQGTRLTPSTRLGIAASGIPDGWGTNDSAKTLGGAIHDIFETRESLEEKQRLLYVACTRARDSLILCGICPVRAGVPKPRENSWLETISGWLGGAENLPLASAAETASSGIYTKETPRKGHAGSVPPPGVRAKPQERISATGYALIRFCPFAFRMRHRQGMDISWEMASDGVGGADLGSLAHWILKRWDLKPETLDRFRPDQAHAALGGILPADLRPVWADTARSGQLMEWLERFACSPAAERIRKAPDAQREVPFRIRLGGGTLMVGTIDVIWREGERIFIRDYKIGRTEGPPRALYDLQLVFYALAARKHFGDHPADLALVSIKDPGETGIDISNISWPGIENDIIAAARNAGSGPFPPNREMCPSCPWRRSCSFS
ncbi:MAG: UvrD-helicase domain-containing protein [Thermovirgaceae bacterium]|nr:UvrD-helicase domain-containing protein [Thermovirgaceae bacterium]